jgi:poly(3-hydroxybutyrate) depolymerase
MRRLPLALLAGLVAASTAARAERPLAARTLEIDGVTRSYYLHVPPALGRGAGCCATSFWVACPST